MMSILYLLMPLAFLLAGGFLMAFILMSRRGQYDDLETPAHRILLDSEFEPKGEKLK